MWLSDSQYWSYGALNFGTLLLEHAQGRLSLSTDGDKCAKDNFFRGGGFIKSLTLSFNKQKCEFCGQT